MRNFRDALKEQEKFWALVILVVAVLILVAVAVLRPPEKDQVIRIIDAAVGGFLLAIGAATNALFRSNTPAPSMEVPLDPVTNQPNVTAPPPPPAAEAPTADAAPTSR